MDRAEVKKKAKYIYENKAYINESTGHWKYIGAHNNGYGKVYLDGKQIYVHSVMYQGYVKMLLPGERLYNKCGVKECINPEHWGSTCGDVDYRRRVEDLRADVFVKAPLMIEKLNVPYSDEIICYKMGYLKAVEDIFGDALPEDFRERIQDVSLSSPNMPKNSTM